MFRWLKQASSRPATALAMIGPKAADAVLFVGARRPSVAAETGAVTRLNGRTVVVGADAAAQGAVEHAAEQAGALIEFFSAPPDALPFDASTFDIVVAPEVAEWPAERRLSCLYEAVRVLRPGGRLIVMAGGTGAGLLGRFARQPSIDEETVMGLLTRTGLAACRKLAVAETVTYYEGRKSRAT